MPTKYDITKPTKPIQHLNCDVLKKMNWWSFVDPYTHEQPISRVMTNYILTDHKGKPLNNMFVTNVQTENEEKSYYVLLGTLLPRPGSGLAPIANVSAKVILIRFHSFPNFILSRF